MKIYYFVVAGIYLVVLPFFMPFDRFLFIPKIFLFLLLGPFFLETVSWSGTIKKALVYLFCVLAILGLSLILWQAFFILVDAAFSLGLYELLSNSSFLWLDTQLIAILILWFAHSYTDPSGLAENCPKEEEKESNKEESS